MLSDEIGRLIFKTKIGGFLRFLILLSRCETFDMKACDEGFNFVLIKFTFNTPIPQGN